MTEDYAEEVDGLLGPREWLILGVVLLGVYLYNKFSHRLRTLSGGVTLGSSTTVGTSAGGPASLTTDDDARRRQVVEARRRLLEEAERTAQLNREKQQAKEEQRRKEMLERKDRLLDVNKATSSKSSKALRGDDYNPLMGAGGSCGWRPSKKSNARGG